VWLKFPITPFRHNFRIADNTPRMHQAGANNTSARSAICDQVSGAHLT